MKICPKCGLREQACICEQMGKSSQRISVRIDKKRYGKLVTIVSGFDKTINIKEIAKNLKNELACGGTTREDSIELQGDHIKRIKEILIKMGFEGELID